MATQVTSFALTAEERAALQAAADERFNGSVAHTIRAALAARYPDFAKAPTVSKPGRKHGQKFPRKK